MFSSLKPRMSRWPQWVIGFSSSIVVLALEGLFYVAPSFAAEQLAFKFGASNSSVLLIPVADLETYAATKTPPAKLQSMMGLIKPEDQAKILLALQTNVKIDPMTLEQLLNSSDGQKILADAAEATLRPNAAGVEALRQALMTSAKAPAGLNVINFLKSYQGQENTMTVDLMQAQKLLEINQKLIAANKAKLEQLVQPVTNPAPAVNTPLR